MQTLRVLERLRSFQGERELTLILFLFGILLTASLLRRGIAMASGRRVTARARVVDKQQSPEGRTAIFLSGGIILRLSVSRSQYNKLEAGQTGSLVYQGGRMLSFSQKK